MLGDWVNTDDKYTVDEEGYFYYIGRSNDMLKVGGIWVSPVEVEACLIEHPAVLECAVVGATDDKNLVKPKAFVVLKRGYAPDDQLKRISRSMSKNARPLQVPAMDRVCR